VSLPMEFNEVPHEANIKQYRAIWDTGATTSVISSKVVADLCLKPISQCISYHAQGQARANVYLVDMFLPNNVHVYKVEAVEGCLNGFDILVGMDIITLGDFVLTHRDGKTVFSFQMPSTHEYDFVRQIDQGVGVKKEKPKKKKH
jgi:predicted aspartyl protease